ncbi:MAG: CopD family protein [Nitrospirae bacterium]|nr:CopD family protein [Nitrospirota bacterium]
MKEVLLVVGAWIHLFASIVWVGGIFFILFAAFPGAKETLEQPGKLMGALSKRFAPLANISILFIFVTGILMSLSSHSLSEITSLGSAWSQALLVKIMLALIMTGIHFYRGLVVAPKITKLTAEGGRLENISGLQKQSLNLVKLNLLFGLTVLLITGILYAFRG